MSTNQSTASGKRAPSSGRTKKPATRLGEMAAKLSHSLEQLHEGTKAVEGYIRLQRAMDGPPRDHPYSVKDDMMLCPLHCAFRDAVWAYLTLRGKRNLRRQRGLTDELFKLSPQVFKAWLDTMDGRLPSKTSRMPSAQSSAAF